MKQISAVYFLTDVNGSQSFKVTMQYKCSYTSEFVNTSWNGGGSWWKHVKEQGENQIPQVKDPNGLMGFQIHNLVPVMTVCLA